MKVKHPRLSKFLKRMNRGVALGLAIILAMTVWLTFSAVRLKRDEPALKALTKQYLTELVEVSMLMNGGEVGSAVPSDVTASMKDQLSDIVAKYYSTSSAAQLTYKGQNNRTGAQALIDGFDEWAKTATVFQVESAEIFETEDVDRYGNLNQNYTFYAEQKGARYIEIYFSFQMRVTLVSDKMASFEVYPFASKGGYVGDYYPDKYPEMSPEYDEFGAVYNMVETVNFSGRLIFVREGGEWRLASTQNISAYVQSTDILSTKKEG